MRDDQLEFIGNDLKLVPKDRLIVLTMHIPVMDETGGGNAFSPEVRARLFELLKPFEHTFSMSAHTHTQMNHFFEKNPGGAHHHYVIGPACGDWWSGWLDEQGLPGSTMRDGTPNGYA